MRVPLAKKDCSDSLSALFYAQMIMESRHLGIRIKCREKEEKSSERNARFS